MDGGRVGYLQLHPNVSVNFQLNRWLSAMTSDAVDDVAALAGRAATRPDLVDGFLALGDRCLADRRRLDAAFCYRAGEFFLPPSDPRKAPARQRFVTLAREAHGIDRRCLIDVPYRGTTLPACSLGRPDRGVLVLFGGFDSCLEEGFGVMSVLAEAGYRVVAFEGPGQGAVLEAGTLPLIPDWHLPVAAVLDHLHLGEVTALGISLGGCLAIRAAAGEPRITRVIADDVLTDFLACNLRQLRPLPRALTRTLLGLHAGGLLDILARRRMREDLLAGWAISHGQRVLGVATPHAYLRACSRYVTADVAHRVTADVLLLAGAEDHYVPLTQLTDQIGTLTQARSVTARVFTRYEQAHNHCQVGNIALSLQVILDWLEGLDRRDGQGAGADGREEPRRSSWLQA